MPGGRPTSYKEDTNLKSLEYLNSCKDTVEVLGSGKDTYIKNNVSLPTVDGLALFLDVSRDTLYEWAKHHQEFSDTLARVKQEQAKVLINKGLSGDYNPTIAKLVLATNHGYHEKQETDITSKGESITIGDPKLAAEFDEFRKQRIKNE